jgi:hypothetical protein
MSKKTACEFKSSFLSTKSFFVKRGAIDVYQNILDLNLFRKLNRLWSDKATEKYQTSETLFSEIKKSSANGKVYHQASPNMDVFNAIDAKRNTKSGGEQLSLLQVSSKEDNKIETLENKLLTFLSRIGVTVKSVAELKATDKDGNQLDAIAVARIFDKLIEVVEGKAKADTLSEEAAHFIVELLGDHSLVQKMLREISDYDIYQEVLAEYSGIEGYDDLALRKEAIGKLIVKILVAKERGEEIPQRALAWWELLWNYIKVKFGRISSSEIKEALSPFEKVAEKITTGDVSDLSWNNIGKATPPVMWQMSQDVVDYRKKIIDNLQKQLVTLDFKTQSYVRLSDNKRVLKRVTDNIKDYYRFLFRHKDLTDEGTLMYAQAGIVIHKVFEITLGKFIRGEAVRHIDVINETEKQLRELEEFKDKPKEYFISIVNNAHFQKVIIPTLKGIVAQVNEVEDRIANTLGLTEEERLQHKATYLTELSVYDAPNDTAGTIDLAVVHSNGAVSIFDWKSMAFDTVGGTTAKEVPWYKRGAWEQQLAAYKTMLGNQYGITEFALSRVIPINVQFNKEGEVRMMQSGYSTVDPNLQPVPHVTERTDNKKINAQLDLLSVKRTKLLEKHLSNRKDKKTLEALDRVDAAIRALQLKQDVDFVYEQIENINKKLKATEHEIEALDPEGRVNPNYLDIYQLNEYREFLDLLQEFSKIAVTQAEELNDEDSIKRYKQINYLNSESLGIIDTKIKDAVFALTGIDITKPAKQATFLGKIFNRVSQYDNPFLKAMSKLIRGNYDASYEKAEEVYEKLKALDEGLATWSKANGLDKFEVFKLFYNEETGMLHRRLSKKFYEDLGEAKKKNNEGWLIDNTQVGRFALSEDSEPYLDYVDEAKERFERSRKRTEEELHRKYDNFKGGDKKIQSLLLAFDKRFNIKKFKEAAYNPNNYFIRIRPENNNYNTKEWEYIQKNNELKDYYDYHTELMEELNTLVDVDIDQHFVANIQKSLIDGIAQGSGYIPKNLLSSILQTLQVHDDDKYRGVLGNDKDNKKVPLMYFTPIREALNSKERKEAEDYIRGQKNVDGSKTYTEETTAFTEALKDRIKHLEYEKGKKNKSIDLSKTTLLFANSVYMNSAFANTEDLVKAMKSLMSGNNQKQYEETKEGKLKENIFTKKISEVMGIPKGDAESFDKFMDLYWYGVSGGNWEKTFELFGRTISVNKASQQLMRYISFKALGLAPLLATGNLVGAESMAFMRAVEGIHFKTGNLVNAIKKITTRDSKYVAFAGFFDPHAQNMTLEKARHLSASKLSEWATADNMFILHRKGDELVDRHVLLAMAEMYGIDPSDGKIKLLTKISDKNVKSLIESAVLTDKKIEIQGLSDKEFKDFKFKVKNQLNLIKGSIPVEDRDLSNSTLLISSIMMFKHWMPGLIRAHHGEFKVDESGDADVGRFSVMIGEFTAKGLLPKLTAFKDLLLEVSLCGFYKGTVNNEVTESYYVKYLKEFKLSNKEGTENYLSKEDFAALRLAKFRASAAEIRVWIAFMLMVVGMKGMIPDDKEDSTRKPALILYRALNRSLLEVGFFIDPTSMMQVVTNPIPQIRLMNDLIKLTKNTTLVSYDLITGDKVDKRKKTRHPFYYSSAMIPGVNKAIDFWDAWDTYVPNGYWKR